MKLKAVIVLLGSCLLSSTLQSHTKTSFQSLLGIALLQAQETVENKIIDKDDPSHEELQKSLAQKQAQIRAKKHPKRDPWEPMGFN